jgi:hypothetical protein
MQILLFPPPSPRVNPHFPTPRCQGLEERSAHALQSLNYSQTPKGKKARESHVSKVLAESGDILCH